MAGTTALTYEILLALTDADRHGYGIIKEVDARGGAAPSTGALYLALQRMEGEGLIEEAPQTPSADDDKRRKYYRVTSRGREVAELESLRLARLVEAAKAKKLLPRVAAGTGEA